MDGEAKNERIGQALRRRREELGWTQIEAARAVGVNRATYSQYETGYIDPPCSVVYRLVSGMSMPADELFGITEHAVDARRKRAIELLEEATALLR